MKKDGVFCFVLIYVSNKWFTWEIRLAWRGGGGVWGLFMLVHKNFNGSLIRSKEN